MMNSNKCSTCKDNYLLKLYNKCEKECGLNNATIIKFDRMCLRTGDPRSSLTIFKCLNNNTCEECIKYRKYYEVL